MSDFREDRTTIDRPSDDGRREWQGPKLTVLGDARTLTEAGGATNADGGGNFSS